MAGVAAARELAAAGLRATLFDRGNAIGGRCGTRYDDGGSFDHGAQYFTVEDPAFAAAVDALAAQGVVQPWRGHIVTLADGSATEARATRRYVGTPGMRSVVEVLAEPFEVATQTRIAAVRDTAHGWSVVDEDGFELGEYDAVLLAMPPEQARSLVPAGSPLVRALGEVRSTPSWALMLGFDEPLPLDYDGAVVENHEALAWIARDSSKPGRRGERWVAHAQGPWARAYFSAAPARAADALTRAFFEVTGIAPCPTPIRKAHRWGLARVDDGPRPGALWDEELRIGICGDWCVAPRLEGAYLSGVSCARMLTASLRPSAEPMSV